MLLLVAAVLLALAGGCWWLQRVAFDPGVSGPAAEAVFEDGALREQVATAVGAATAERMGQPAEALAGGILANFPLMLRDPQVGEILAGIVGESHARLIGERAEPPQIDGQQMVLFVRHQSVFDVAAAALPVDEIGWLAAVDTITRWVMVLSLVAGVAALVLGILARPSRGDVLFSLGVLCVAGAIAAFLLGYVVPAYAIDALADEPWASLFPAVARTQLPAVGAWSAVLAVIGCVLVLATAGFGRRKTKTWSAPVRPARYSSEQRQWSR